MTIEDSYYMGEQNHHGNIAGESILQKVSCARNYFEGMVRKGDYRGLYRDASSVGIVLAIQEAPSPDQVDAVLRHHLLAHPAAGNTPPS